MSPEIAQPVHLHVVIQVSVFNDHDYEVDAINDLVTRAVAGQGDPPKLGVMIKHRAAVPVYRQVLTYIIFLLALFGRMQKMEPKEQNMSCTSTVVMMLQ
jgi:hypothetical protein